MSTTASTQEVHPLVFLGTVLYAMAVIGLLFLYWDWFLTLAMG